jgi:hypothetical protein
MSSHNYIYETELKNVKFKIKLKKCPHCGIVGMFILHGYVYGYTETRTDKNIKGRRIFCSNRNKRTGCGKTLYYRIIDFLKQTLISSSTAWDFLHSIVSEKSIEKAYDSLNPECVISLTTFFRLWKKFKLHIHKIRSNLANRYPIIKTNEVCPYLETIRQLEKTFTKTNNNPIAEYQKVFQKSFI